MKEKTVVSVIFEDEDEIEVRIKDNLCPMMSGYIILSVVIQLIFNPHLTCQVAMESTHSEGATFFHANLKTGTAYPEDLLPHEDEVMHIPNTRSVEMVPLPAVPLPQARALSSTGYRQVSL